MKLFLYSGLALSLTASLGMAGSVDEPPISANISAPAAATTDWSGFYAGGLVSFDSGVAEGYFTGIHFDTDNFTPATGFGGFAGYNIQRGSFVYGGELGVVSSGMTSTGAPFPTQNYYADAKARIGYSFGKVMIFGVAGASFGQNENNFGTFSQVGFVYGAGADLMLTDRLFVGVEYLTREIIGPGVPDPDYDYLSSIQSINLRAGINF